MQSIIAKFVFVTLIAMGSAFTAQAQSHTDTTKHNHDHDEATSPIAVPDIDHVYTEAPDDHTIGDVSAPVSLIVYASVTCGHCSKWFTTEWPKLKAEHINTGNLRVIFREFPTAPGQVSMAGFLMANCAPSEDFFPIIEHQMEQQDAMFDMLKAGTAAQYFTDLETRSGLTDDEKVKACLASDTHYNKINSSMLRARAAGLKGVPGFKLNGTLYTGDSSASGLSDVITKLLDSGVTRISNP